MSDYRKRLGDYGEQLACRYYTQKGYILLEKKYRCCFGEIDLILKKGNRIYFVEVKTRTTRTFGSPEESINFKKQRTILKVSLYYMQQFAAQDPYLPQDSNLQYDVLSIFIDKTRQQAFIKRFPNAFP